MTFDVSAFNAAEKAAGERRRAELGPGWNVFNPATGRWEWVAEQATRTEPMDEESTRPDRVKLDRSVPDPILV